MFNIDQTGRKLSNIEARVKHLERLTAGNGGTAGGTGITGRLATWATSTTLGASTAIKSGLGILTLSASSDYTLTVADNSSIAGTLSGSGTIATAGYTGTLAATGTFAMGSGTANRLAYWVDANTLETSYGLTTVGDLIYMANNGSLENQQYFSTSSDTYPGSTTTTIATLTFDEAPGPGETVDIIIDMWLGAGSLSPGGSATFRIRRTNTSGSILASVTKNDAECDYNPHCYHWDTTINDASPVQTYVLTVTVDPFSNGYSDYRDITISKLSADPLPARLPIGSEGDLLTVSSGIPAWSAISTLLDGTYLRLDATNGPMQGSLDFGGYAISNLDYLDFDLTPSTSTNAEGRLQWNSEDGALQYGLPGGNVVNQIGQELQLPRRVKNNTGSDMSNGDLVYISGGDGTNVYIELAKADAEGTSANTIAMLTEDITAGQFGWATTFGLVRGEAGQPIDTSSYTAGDTLYLSPSVAGGFTGTKPSAPNHLVKIGTVFRAHATEGIVVVSIDNGWELDELHDVAITGLLTGDLLKYNGSTWANTTVADLLDGTYLTRSDYADRFSFGILMDYAGNYETTVAFDGTNTFTLAPTGSSWSYWRNGVKYTISGSKTVDLSGTPPAAKGTYHIYIDSTDGSLTASTSGWTLADTKVPIATVVWDPALTPDYWLFDERHSAAIDRRYHYEHHYTDGSEVKTLSALSGYTVTPSSPVDTDNTFAISEGEILDEDHLHTQAAVADPNGVTTPYVIWYRNGAGIWNWVYSEVPYRYTAAGYIQYDSAGTMTEGANNKFYNTYLLQTSATGAAAFSFIHGQAEYSTLSLAQAENFTNLVKTGLGLDEYIAVYQLTWQTSASYGTKGKARLAATPRAISVSASGATAGGSVEHNTLAGIQGGASGEYYHLTSAQATVVANTSGTNTGDSASISATLMTTRGDIIRRGASAAERYALSVPASGTLNYLGVNNGEVDPTWKSASSNPGAAASLLQSDANGYLQLVRLGIATTPTAAIHLGGTGGTAAEGILFGTDVNLYRSAADKLYTPDTFLVGTYLGIGTTSPGQVLDVESTTGAVLRIGRNDTSVNTGNQYGRIEFYSNDSTATYNKIPAAIHVEASANTSFTTVGGHLIFSTSQMASGADLTERLRIRDDGYIGINSPYSNAFFSVGGSGEFFDPDSLGSELVTSYDFSASTGWTTVNATLDVSGAYGKITHSTGSIFGIYQTITTEVNKLYKVTIDWLGTLSSGFLAGSIRVLFGSTSSGGEFGAYYLPEDNETIDKSYTFYFKALTTTTYIRIQANRIAGTPYISCDNFSVKEVTDGNVSSRGVFSGGGTAGIKVDVDGNVGIGNTAPSYELEVTGTIDATDYSVGGSAGASGSFTTVDGKTVTVVNGITTSIV